MTDNTSIWYQRKCWLSQEHLETLVFEDNHASRELGLEFWLRLELSKSCMLHALIWKTKSAL